MTAANDNARPSPVIRIIGVVGGDGRVTLTDAAWRPSPRPAPRLAADPPVGEDPRREA